MKQAVSRVWSVVGIYMQAVSFLLALLCVFAVAAPKASAATALTGAQVSAISNLLTSLNVDQATIDKVQADLTASPSFSGAHPSDTSNAPDQGGRVVPLPRTLPIASSSVSTSSLVSLPNRPIPSCSLMADKTSLGKGGGQVTLTWTSKNATSVSTQGGGMSTQVNGSVTLNVTESTQFVKRVFNAGTSGSCSVTVTVEGDQSVDKKIVWNPLPSLMNTIAEMQVGAAFLADQSAGLLFGTQFPSQ